jgi:hypothetical protein
MAVKKGFFVSSLAGLLEIEIDVLQARTTPSIHSLNHVLLLRSAQLHVSQA